MSIGPNEFSVWNQTALKSCSVSGRQTARDSNPAELPSSSQGWVEWHESLLDSGRRTQLSSPHYRILSLPCEQWLSLEDIGTSRKNKHTKLAKWCSFQTHCWQVSVWMKTVGESVALNLVLFWSIHIYYCFFRWRVWLVSYSRCCI